MPSAALHSPENVDFAPITAIQATEQDKMIPENPNRNGEREMEFGRRIRARMDLRRVKEPSHFRKITASCARRESPNPGLLAREAIVKAPPLRSVPSPSQAPPVPTADLP